MPGRHLLYLLCDLSAVVMAVLCHLGSDPPSFQGRLLPSSPHLGPGGGGWFHQCCRWKRREGEGQNPFLRSLKGAPVGRPLRSSPGLWWWRPWSALLLTAVLEVSLLGPFAAGPSHSHRCCCSCRWRWRLEGRGRVINNRAGGAGCDPGCPLGSSCQRTQCTPTHTHRGRLSWPSPPPVHYCHPSWAPPAPWHHAGLLLGAPDATLL